MIYSCVRSAPLNQNVPLSAERDVVNDIENMSTPGPPRPTLHRPPRPALLKYTNSKEGCLKSLNHARCPTRTLHSTSLRACFINAVQKKHAAVCVEVGVGGELKGGGCIVCC